MARRGPNRSAYLTGGAGQFQMEIGPESVKIGRTCELIAAPVWGQQIKAQEFGNMTGRTLQVSNVEVHRYFNSCGSIEGVINGVERLMNLGGGGVSGGKAPNLVTFLYSGSRFGPAVLTNLVIEKYLWRNGQLTNAKVSFELLEVPDN